MKHFGLGDKIHLKKIFYYYIVILLLTVPLRWILAGILSVCIHEMCHIIALKLFKIEIFEIQIGALGAEIHIEPIAGWKEFVCLGAGPAGSLMLICLIRWIPITSSIGFLHGLFNLLPLMPLDGGRMLACVLKSFLNSKSVQTILDWVEFVIYILAIIVVVSIPKDRLQTTAGILFLVVFMLYRKIPCKLQ